MHATLEASAVAATMYKDCFRIRTITCFITLRARDFTNEPEDDKGSSFCGVEKVVQTAATFLQTTRQLFESDGYTIQTVRIATNPFGEWLMDDEGSVDRLDVMEQRLRKLNQLLEEFNLDFCSVGPATTVSQVKQCILPILHSSDKLSVSASLAWNDVSMAHQCAETIQQIALETKDGLGNFRFCVAAAAVDYIPFFPVAKSATATNISSNDIPVYKFSIGLENGVLLNQLLQRCSSIVNIPTILASGFVDALTPIQQLCEQLSDERFEFVGIDTSLNPSLDVDGSIAAAIEMLDEVEHFGGPGTLAAASIITKTLQSLPGINHCGYSGIMLPVCEDHRLSELTGVIRNGTPALRISDLLGISQVCGVGIDTVPVPGDCSTTDLASVLLDVAGLAHRWNKSLSCRVFPVPGQKVGDRTNFDSPYMVNAKILSLSP
jgi:hypothetical protein